MAPNEDLEIALRGIAIHGQNLLEQTKGIEPTLSKQGVPGLDAWAGSRHDVVFRDTCKNLAEAATQLLKLAQDPREYLEHLAQNNQNLVCLRWLINLKVLERIPLNDHVSYMELATSADVPEQQLKSVCRMAITYGLLSEPAPDHVGHSRNSALLLQDDSFMNWARFLTNYSVPTAYQFPDATRRWGTSEAKNETAYQLAMGIEVPFFDHLRRDQALNGMFSSYMRNVASADGTSFKHLINGFNWKALPKGAKIVDVGGSAGHASIALAKEYQHLNFIVQDLPETLSNATKSSDFTNVDALARVSFMAHDFFQPQPIEDADVYLLRMIIHDWPYNEASKILSHLVAAMKKPGARVIIMDTVLPQPGTIPVLEERQLRVRDLTMMQVFNAKEREVEDWRNLTKDVDLEILHIEQPAGSAMALIQLGSSQSLLATQNGVSSGIDGIRDLSCLVSQNLGEPNLANGTAAAIGGSMTSDDSKPVLIIGAGIGGLCLAQALRKSGIEFRVLERDLSVSHRPQGYRLKLESDAADALRECLPDNVFKLFLHSCAINTFGETDFDPVSGTITKSRAGGGLAGEQGLRASFTVDRSTFRQVLMTGIEERIIFGKSLTSYTVDHAESLVNASFEDGTKIQGRTLVGADGTRSMVRRLHLPDHRYVDTGAVCIYGKTPITPELAARFPGKGLRWMTVCVDSAPLIQSILIGDSPLTLLSEPIRFDATIREHVHVPDDYVYWVLIGRKEVFQDSSEVDTISAELSAKRSLELTQEWDQSIRSLFELQDTTQCSTLRVISATPEIPAWTPSGHVTLLGDAVHAMSPCGGVGANTALRDAAELAGIYRAGKGILSTENVGAFEDGMRKRAFKSLMRSYVGSKRMFDQRPFGACPVVDV